MKEREPLRCSVFNVPHSTGFQSHIKVETLHPPPSTLCFQEDDTVSLQMLRQCCDKGRAQQVNNRMGLVTYWGLIRLKSRRNVEPHIDRGTELNAGARHHPVPFLFHHQVGFRS